MFGSDAPYSHFVERCRSQEHALTLLLEHVLAYGKAAHVAVFRKHHADLAEFAGLCSLMLPNHSAVWDREWERWHFPSGASLTMRRLADEEDAYNYAGYIFTMLIFDAVSEWQPDYRPLHFMTSTLRSADDIPCRILTVGD